MPLQLSMGIPAGPDAESLRNRLESVLAQERSFDEIVVADNHLPDTAAEVLQRFSAQIRVIRPPQPLPAVALWNFLAEHMTGDWISLLAPGDTACPNYGRAVEEAVALSPEAAVMRAGYRRLRPDGSPGELHTLYSVRSVTHPPEALYEQRFGPRASLAAFALKRSVWTTLGGFPGSGDRLGDWALWLLAGAVGDTVRSREVIADSATPAVHSSPGTGNKPAEVSEMYGIFREVLPRTAAAAGLGSPLWIEAASRKRFRDVVIASSNEFAPRERAALVEALLPWARSVQQLPLLRRLERGERIRTFPFGRRVKPVLKRVIHAVR